MSEARTHSTAPLVEKTGSDGARGLMLFVYLLSLSAFVLEGGRDGCTLRVGAAFARLTPFRFELCWLDLRDNA